MSFDFRDWYRDASQLLDRIGRVAELFESPKPYEGPSLFFPPTFDEDSVNTALEQLRIEAQSFSIAELRNGHEQILPQLKLVYFRLGNFETPREDDFAICGDELIGLVWDKSADSIVERRQSAYHFAGNALLDLAVRIESWDSHFAEQLNLINPTDVVYWMSRATWLRKMIEVIRSRLLLEESLLLQNTPKPPAPAKIVDQNPGGKANASKGGRNPKIASERAEQVHNWWEQFKKDPRPEGYETPDRLRKGSSDDFIEWGRFKEVPNFPTSKEEVEHCKRRYRYLHSPKSDKTSPPKRRSVLSLEKKQLFLP